MEVKYYSGYFLSTRLFLISERWGLPSLIVFSLLSLQSDHSIVNFNLTTYSGERGPGVWKFNCSFLKDNEYTHFISNIIHSANTTDQYQSLALKWDFIKYQLRKVSSNYGKIRATERSKNETETIEKKHFKLREILS